MFSNGEFYHIYNRGVDKRTTFLDDGDRIRFCTYLQELNQTARHPQSLSRDLTRYGDSHKPTVTIHAFCLMDNHYHLLVSQRKKNGVSQFMHRLGIAYTKFFNTKYERTGSLFESRYKVKHLLSTGYLLRVADYIHANPLELLNVDVRNAVTALKQYRWSSFADHLGDHRYRFIDVQTITNHYNDRSVFYVILKTIY
jgi:REP element-mobilizing transposase RayT